jgi:hypothetical protein
LLGSTSTVQFITSGFGVLAFLLYLPGGLGELLRRAGDGVATLVVRYRTRGEPPPDDSDDSVLDAPRELAGAGTPAGGDA